LTRGVGSLAVPWPLGAARPARKYWSRERVPLTPRLRQSPIQDVATQSRSYRCPRGSRTVAGLACPATSARNAASAVGVGFVCGAVCDLASRSPGPCGRGSRFAGIQKWSRMPEHPNSTPGRKPRAPSVKRRPVGSFSTMVEILKGRLARHAEDAELSRRAPKKKRRRIVGRGAKFSRHNNFC
jgi:hypothetical protein